MSVTSIRLRPEMESPLAQLAKKLDRSKNYLINQAIKEFLEHQGVDEKRWLETLDAIDSVKKGKTIDEQDVNNWLDSWGSKNEINPPTI